MEASFSHEEEGRKGLVPTCIRVAFSGVTPSGLHLAAVSPEDEEGRNVKAQTCCDEILY